MLWFLPGVGNLEIPLGCDFLGEVLSVTAVSGVACHLVATRTFLKEMLGGVVLFRGEGWSRAAGGVVCIHPAHLRFGVHGWKQGGIVAVRILVSALTSTFGGSVWVRTWGEAVCSVLVFSTQYLEEVAHGATLCLSSLPWLRVPTAVT